MTAPPRRRRPEPPPPPDPAPSPPRPAAAAGPTAGGAAALARALRLAREAHAESTRRAYRADWAHFEGWCATAGFPALPAPPEAVAAFLAAHEGALGRASLRRRLAAIAQRHRGAGHLPSPTEHPGVRATLRGLLRRHGAPPRRAAALGTAELRALSEACGGDGLAGLRDRAMLLLGYAGALRRAELVAVEVAHLAPAPDGRSLRLLVPRSKTDPEGEGATLHIPRGRRRATCPVRALRDWLAASGIASGPVFRAVVARRGGGAEAGPPRALHPDGVRRVLLRRAREAGVAAPALERLSPHGLRAGFVTEAYRAGARDEAIMEHTRHRDARTMRGYVRRARLGAAGGAARLLGL